MIVVREVSPNSSDVEIISPENKQDSFYAYLGALSEGIMPGLDLSIEDVVSLSTDISEKQSYIRNGKKLFVLDAGTDAVSTILQAYEYDQISSEEVDNKHAKLTEYMPEINFLLTNNLGIVTSEQFVPQTYPISGFIKPGAPGYEAVNHVGATEAAMQCQIVGDTVFKHVSYGKGQGINYQPIMTMLSDNSAT